MNALNPNSSSSAAQPLAIEATGLTKRFGQLLAVDRLDLSVPAGTVFSLLGPNGSGKTTTVRMLATLLAPDAGSARVNGYDIRTEGAKVRSVISLTGQFAALDPNLTARENLVLMARLRGHGRADSGRIADELLERFDGAEFASRLVKQLSGGQRRRVDLAAGLIDKPKLLALDEPTTGLDPRSRQVVWSTVRDLVADGITLLLTTQYLEEADALADHIVLIDHGREIAAGTPSQLKALVGDQRVDVIAQDAFGYEQLATRLRDSGFELTLQPEQRRVSIPAPDELEDLARVSEALATYGISIDELALRRPTLDDAFISLTGRQAQDADQIPALPAAEELSA
jgi:daunorubicin resistance ABC transporter ATP-binding subunit